MGAVSEMRREDGTAVPSQSVDVRLEDVSKRFADVWALRPTDLSIDRGEFFSLLGASGSGKTTTLRMIGGFERPSSGRIFLRDRDVTAMPPYERPVNTVFQDYALFPHMSVADNIAYGMKVQRIPRAERRRRVADALDLVRLTGLEDRRPSQLSGGQRQRVALARAVVNAPAVLLLDEPLGALDLKLRREMQIELKRIQQNLGITFLYVTHDQEEALSMSDRIAVMRDGRIEQIGPPAEVYERPLNAFVAGFVGISNMLEGVVREAGAACRVEVSGLGPIAASGHPGVAAGENVLVTVRPEKITMLRRPGTGENSVCGRIKDVSYLGAFTRYGVDAGGATLAVVEQNEGIGPAAGVGEEVWLSWAIEQTLVLSGSREDHAMGRRAAVPVE